MILPPYADRFLRYCKEDTEYWFAVVLSHGTLSSVSMMAVPELLFNKNIVITGEINTALFDHEMLQPDFNQSGILERPCFNPFSGQWEDEL